MLDINWEGGREGGCLVFVVSTFVHSVHISHSFARALDLKMV